MSKNACMLAHQVRIDALKMTSEGNSSHVGSVLSSADILGVLYGNILKYRHNDPCWRERDIFLLSKGHAGAGIYSILSQVGFFERARIKDHYKNGSLLSGHVSHKGNPGIELSTGSLGMALGVGTGMALSFKKRGSKQSVYVLMSDGECNEGANWEAILFASHHKLDNLCAIIDYNGLQSIDTTSKTLNLEPFKEKWEAFGFYAVLCDGHNIEELNSALRASTKGKPKVVICKTIKGKGVSFMENNVLWHYRSPNEQELQEALRELGEN